MINIKIDKMGKVKILSDETILEIIRLYSTGECASKEILGKKFDTSKRVISRILIENNVETIRPGTRNKIVNVTDGNKYIADENYDFIAKHKVTGKEFKDYNNVSGALISYIKEVDSEIEVPTKFIRSSYYKKTGNYWYEQYFDIVKIENVATKKKGELSTDDINEIIRLYQTKEVSSTHKLAEMFKVGHKKISEILKDNNIQINSIGGVKFYPSEFESKYKELDDYVYKAIHKETNVVLDDYNNTSGALTKYISENNPDANILELESEKKRYLLNTGNYWYEQYFDIVKISKNDLKLKKCPYCNNDIDMSISDIKYKNHLSKIHKVDIEEHVKLYPKDSLIFKNELIEINNLKDKDNWIECKICGEKFGIINSFHLSKHNISVPDYKLKYGNNVSKKFLEDVTTRLNSYNINGLTTSYTSKPEKEVGEYLISLGVNIETNRQMLIGKEIDILSHEHKLGIEFNGCKWHTEWFGKKDCNYHLNKTIACNNKGYSLIHIFEDEWMYNKDLIKHKLKHIFNKDSDLPKVGARKTVVREIDKDTEKKFLDEYHIQGVGQSSVSVGAYYNDELIGVMTFKKLLQDKNDYDLTRFATNYNYIYQGLASKMLSYFIKNYNPDSVISFADRRWTTDKDNNLYTKLGFSLESIGKPDYKYYNEKVDRYKRFHKFGFRKQILNKRYGLDLTMTETEMVKVLGFDRIWDCGLLKYRLELKKGSI